MTLNLTSDEAHALLTLLDRAAKTGPIVQTSGDGVTTTRMRLDTLARGLAPVRAKLAQGVR